MFDTKTEDNSMGCCGVAYMSNFPTTRTYNKDNIFGGAMFKKDVDKVLVGIAKARASNRAVVIATTIPTQKYGAELLEAAGFKQASTSERPSRGSGNTIITWTCGTKE
jgi:hypothetical protein